MSVYWSVSLVSNPNFEVQSDTGHDSNQIPPEYFVTATLLCWMSGRCFGHEPIKSPVSMFYCNSGLRQIPRYTWQTKQKHCIRRNVEFPRLRRAALRFCSSFCLFAYYKAELVLYNYLLSLDSFAWQRHARRSESEGHARTTGLQHERDWKESAP